MAGIYSTIYTCGYILRKEITKDMIPAGEFAFSQHTLLNPPKLKTYAIEKKHSKNIKLQRGIVIHMMNKSSYKYGNTIH